jgi:hypothetical protein
MTLIDGQKPVYGACSGSPRNCANATPVVLPYYVEQIVMAAETARENERIVPGPQE